MYLTIDGRVGRHGVALPALMLRGNVSFEDLTAFGLRTAKWAILQCPLIGGIAIPTGIVSFPFEVVTIAPEGLPKLQNWIAFCASHSDRRLQHVNSLRR